MRFKMQYKRKICKFCENKEVLVDYKNSSTLKRFLTEEGKILPRRITGTCASHQRQVVTAIKRARNIALIAYSADVKNV